MKIHSVTTNDRQRNALRKQIINEVEYSLSTIRFNLFLIPASTTSIAPNDWPYGYVSAHDDCGEQRLAWRQDGCEESAWLTLAIVRIWPIAAEVTWPNLRFNRRWLASAISSSGGRLAWFSRGINSIDD